MKILVTAFGPFGGRTRNASSNALSGLKKRFPWIRTRILPVDHLIAPNRMSRAIRQVHPDAILMLGEAGGTHGIRLETMAWNELDFRIPDNGGSQPQNQLIDAGASPHLASTLAFDDLHGRLIEAGHACEMSEDPGRYLCNQILFHTLRHLEKHRPHVRAGFIHLPLETEYPTSQAVEALAVTIRWMLNDQAP